VRDVPKPLAPVGGVPFLEYPLCWLERSGVRHVVLSIGYRGAQIAAVAGKTFGGMSIAYCADTESAPLGTGGAARQAAAQCSAPHVFLVNGDTFFDVNLTELLDFHVRCDADVTVALKELSDFDRYGAVALETGASGTSGGVGGGGKITAFCEKQRVARGYINGGVYCIRRGVFDGFALPEQFSFEKDFLAIQVGRLNLLGLPFDAHFIDIGIPKDYRRAQELMPKWFTI
jgi:D-glycero-alpha-D-manno-heptose 1-phosphate guanylyltransferase